VYNVTCPNCSGEYNLTKNGKEIIGIKFPIEAKLIKEKISFFSFMII
jgi:plasmid replication initiation protein